jgi:hypothetical protein
MEIHFRKLLFLIFALILVLSCSKESEILSEPINQNGGEVFRSQIVIIALTGVTLTELEYLAVIDGITVKLFKASDNQLTFMVPNSTALGLKDLVIPALDNAVVHYDVKETVLTQNPSETLAPLLANLDIFSQSVDGSPEAIEAQGKLDSFNTYYANATEAEKIEMAQVYKANKLLIDSIVSDRFAGRSSISNGTCVGIAVIGVGVSIWLVVNPGTAVLGIAVLAVSVYKFKSCGKPLYDEYVIPENIKANDYLGTKPRVTSNAILFGNDVSATVTLKIVKRKLIASDATKTEPIWTSFFSNLNLFNAHIDTANIVINTLNNLPFVTITPFDSVILPSSSTDIDVSADETMFNSLNFTVNHPNLQLISSTMQSNGQMSIKIKIVGTPVSYPVEGILNYTYTDELNSFAGTFEIEVERSLAGVWLMESFNNGVPVGQFINNYHPQCPNIILFEYTYESETITFNVDGTFGITANEIYIHNNMDLDDATCTILNSYPDTIETPEHTASGTYTVDGNNLTFHETENSTVNLVFLTSNKIKVGDIVYNRQ